MKMAKNELLVKDIMTKGVKAISYRASIKDAAEKMIKEKVSLLLVTDDNNNKENFIGVVTRKDVAFRAIRKAANVEDVLVANIMSSPISTVNENLSVYNLCKILGERKYKRMVVESEGKIVGVVSTTDVLKAVAEGKI